LREPATLEFANRVRKVRHFCKATQLPINRDDLS
jgi:hypothetical protein